MIIGFTGTRSGMSEKQKGEVRDFLMGVHHDVEIAIHGGCIGADIDFHKETDFCKREVYVGHSAKNPDDKSYIGEFSDADIIHESQTHFKRNRDIVDRCDILLATPYNNNQQGGTWYTINYARKQGKDVIIMDR